MKKFLVSVAVAISAVSFSSCGGVGSRGRIQFVFVNLIISIFVNHNIYIGSYRWQCAGKYFGRYCKW